MKVEVQVEVEVEGSQEVTIIRMFPVKAEVYFEETTCVKLRAEISKRCCTGG